MASSHGIFSSNFSWTGRESVEVKEKPATESVPVTGWSQPNVEKDVVKFPMSAKFDIKLREPKTQQHLDEYAELAALTGVVSDNLTINRFEEFLYKNDIPTFNLGEVVRYMDEIAKKESKEQAGWDWHPLRDKDHMLGARFGTEAEWGRNQYGHSTNLILRPASDYYRGPYEYRHRSHATGEEATHTERGLQSVYNRTIPLHALRKVAVIEKQFGNAVSMFVSDYALQPQVPHPDPFLMAVVMNHNLKSGVGRYVIDFWDEPGFGLESQLK